MPLEEFISSHERDMKHFMGCLGYNIIACDMGALPHQYNDQKAIRLLVSMKRPQYAQIFIVIINISI